MYQNTRHCYRHRQAPPPPRLPPPPSTPPKPTADIASPTLAHSHDHCKPTPRPSLTPICRRSSAAVHVGVDRHRRRGQPPTSPPSSAIIGTDGAAVAVTSDTYRRQTSGRRAPWKYTIIASTTTAVAIPIAKALAVSATGGHVPGPRPRRRRPRGPRGRQPMRHQGHFNEF